MSYEVEGVGGRGRRRTTWNQVVERDTRVWNEEGGCAIAVGNRWKTPAYAGKIKMCVYWFVRFVLSKAKFPNFAAVLLIFSLQQHSIYTVIYIYIYTHAYLNLLSLARAATDVTPPNECPIMDTSSRFNLSCSQFKRKLIYNNYNPHSAFAIQMTQLADWSLVNVNLMRESLMNNTV